MADFPTPVGTTRVVFQLLTSTTTITAVPDPVVSYAFVGPDMRTQTWPALKASESILTAVPEPLAPYLFNNPLASKWPYPATIAPEPPPPVEGPPPVVYDKWQIWPRGQGKVSAT